MTVGTASPSVFDADLPTLAYDAEETPAEIYPRLQAAQRQAPIALGTPTDPKCSPTTSCVRCCGIPGFRFRPA